MLTSYHCSPVDFKKICQIFDLKFNPNKEVHNVQRIKGICLMYSILKIWVFNDTVWVFYMFYFIFNFFFMAGDMDGCF